MRRRSFTLLELLITIGIIVVLAGITVGGLRYASNRGDEAKTMATLQQFEMALEKYKSEKGLYPISKDDSDKNPGTAVEVDLDNDMWKKFAQGRYVEGQISGKVVDSYGKALWYRCPGKKNTEKFDLWAVGPDGKHGNGSSNADKAGEEGSDDITNWTKN